MLNKVQIVGNINNLYMNRNNLEIELNLDINGIYKTIKVYCTQETLKNELYYNILNVGYLIGINGKIESDNINNQYINIEKVKILNSY